MKKVFAVSLVIMAALALLMPVQAMAASFKIAIMQDQAGAARAYKPLLDYLAQKGVAAEFVAAKDYPAAAAMFADGSVDAMFSGSGIAGSFIIKELAAPVVRPVSSDGFSTYWAVVIAPKGSPKFTGSADYFKGKKVVFTSLASSGEFFFRSIPGSVKSGAVMTTAASHGAAIDALSRGMADVAIVKNRVWDKEKSKFTSLELVGEDKGENPDNTLIASKTADAATVAKVSEALLGLEADTSALASEAKSSLKVKGYVKTTEADFGHTVGMLKKAGVTKAFNFKY